MTWIYSGSSVDSYWYPNTSSENQHAAAITLPANCAITQIYAKAAGYGGSVSTRLIVWEEGGDVIVQSSTFTMESGGIGDLKDNTQSITHTYLSAGTYWVGLYHNYNRRHIFGTDSNEWSYVRTNTQTFPSVKSMSSYSTYEDDGAYVGLFYITTPDPCTSANTVRNDDTSITFSWTNNDSTDQPYTNLYIERYDNVTDDWYEKATLSGSVENYTDTTVITNRTYQYRVRVYNAAGYSSYLTGSEINTTPAAPTTVSAVRSGSNVELTWVDNATNEDQFRIQKRSSSDGGETWGAWGSDQTVTANLEIWTDTSPATYGQYRIRAEETGQNLYSSYVESNEVVTIAPPNVPTNLLPDDVNFDGDADYDFTWQHNTTDNTDQTKYSITYKVSGGAYPGTPQVDEESGSTESHTFSASTFTNGTTYLWKAKTWGLHATGSDWSTEATFTSTTTPVATITTPSAVVDYTTSTLTMEWSYTQAESNDQVEYLASLLDDADVVLETKTVSDTVASGASGTCTFDYTLEDSTTYKVTLQVKESNGLWSDETSVTFDTVFVIPPQPSITATIDHDGGYVSVVIVNPNAGVGEADTDHNVLYRSVDGGTTYEALLDNIPINTTVVDYTPNLAGINYYFVTAVSDIPTSKISAVINITDILTGAYFFNSGSNYENYIKLYGDTSLTEKNNFDTNIKKYEGRTYPVKYQSLNKDVSLSFSCDLTFDKYDDLLAIIQATGNLMYRDFYGRRFLCNVSDINFARKDDDAYQFSCTITRVSTVN
jgi:hypothetical protein